MKFTLPKFAVSAALFWAVSLLSLGARAADAVSAPAAAASPAPAVSPFAPAVATATAAPTTSGSLLQVIFGLMLVLVILAGVAWFMKRVAAGRGNPGQNIKIVGGVSVGNRERVIVVEVADQWIVVGVAPGSVNALATLPRQENAIAVEAAPTNPNFAHWLKKTIDKRNAS